MPVFSRVMSQLLAALLPFIIAFFIALLLEPLVIRFMRGLKASRPIAAILALVLAIFGIGSIVFLIIARLYTELSDLGHSFPSYGYLVTFFN